MNEYLRRLLFLPERASTMAWPVDRLHYVVIISTFLLSAGVGLTALGLFVRYRRSKGRPPEQVEPPWWFEALIIVAPLSVFLLWFAIGFNDFVRMNTPPKDAMDIYVMAKQWMWKFAYPGGPNAVNVLHVPSGRPVRLLMTSRDVIHSFYVPSFRMKKDVIPGRYTEYWFEATQPGHYQILCAEYCGANHSNMWGEVVAMKPDEFDAWLEREQRGLTAHQDTSHSAGEEPALAGDMVTNGRHLADVHGCLKCHSTDGTPHIGPTWLDLYRRTERLNSGEDVVADEAYLTESMMDPLAKVVAGYAPVMPTFQGKLAGPETAALLEYIKSLRTDRLGHEPAGAATYEQIPHAQQATP